MGRRKKRNPAPRSVNVEILPAACEDLVEGFAFYEKQSPGIGVRFLDSMFSDIDSLVHNAGIHSLHYERYHRRLASRFPFAIYYRIQEDTAVVFAVLDCRQDPAIVQQRLGE